MVLGVKMKYLSIAVVSACALFAATSVQAEVVFTDTTKLVAYNKSNPTNHFGGSSVGDVVGARFDTKSLTVSETSNTITLKYLTQFDGNELTANYADVFLAVNDASGSPASYGFGVSLGYQLSKGGVASGLYALDAGDYKTSVDIWKSKTSYTYGGRYIAPGEVTPQLAPTVITGGELLAGWTVASSITNVGGSHPYELTITLSAADAAAFALLSGNYLDILWGTGDCANDPIFAAYERPTVPAPEPASILLLGGGLMLLARRRRK